MKFQKNTKLSNIVSGLALLALCLILATASASKPVAAQDLIGGPCPVFAGNSSQIPPMFAPLNMSFSPPNLPNHPVPNSGHPGDPIITGGTLRYANDSPITVTSPRNGNGAANWIYIKSWKVNVPVTQITQARVNLTASSSTNMTWEVVITNPSGGFVWSFQTALYITNWGLVQAAPVPLVFDNNYTFTLYFKAQNSLSTAQMSNGTFEIYW